MFTKLARRKVFRDPLYGYINVDYKIISDLIDTKEVQRLRRIRQLSGVSMVFHTAEHSRFSHALGTYEVARKILENVCDIRNYMHEYEQLVFLISALLHDIGHGPYSHSFEHVFNIHHEKMTCLLILGNTEVNRVLSVNAQLILDVVDVISHGGKYPLIESLISSQLDVDRLDYLQRDSFFTGTPYGKIDMDRLMRSMTVHDNVLCYKASGVHTIENYLMSRYHMYWQVYYHPVTRSFENILESIYRRISDLIKEGKKLNTNVDILINVLNNNYDINSYIELDDAYVNGMIKQCVNSSDPILSQMCTDFMDRNLFEYIDLDLNEDEKLVEGIINKFTSDEILKRYYYAVDSVRQVTYYQNTQSTFDVKNIFILTPSNKLVALDEFSKVMHGLIESGNKESKKIYYKYPRGLECLNK